MKNAVSLLAGVASFAFTWGYFLKWYAPFVDRAAEAADDYSVLGPWWAFPTFLVASAAIVAASSAFAAFVWRRFP